MANWNFPTKNQVREQAIPSYRPKLYLCLPADGEEIRLMRRLKRLNKNTEIIAAECNQDVYRQFRQDAKGLCKLRCYWPFQLEELKLPSVLGGDLIDGAFLDYCNSLTPKTLRWLSDNLSSDTISEGAEVSFTFNRVRVHPDEFYRWGSRLRQDRFNHLSQTTPLTIQHIVDGVSGAIRGYDPSLVAVRTYKGVGGSPMVFFKLRLVAGSNSRADFTQAWLAMAENATGPTPELILDMSRSPQQRAHDRMRAVNRMIRPATMPEDAWERWLNHPASLKAA